MPTYVDQELIAAARGLVAHVTGADRKYENTIYYRQPDAWEAGTPRERRNPHAGWIVRAGNNRDRLADMLERGFVPLRQFGVSLKNPAWTPEAQGTPDQYGEWGAILCHPEGPAAFPLSQVLTFRWYDPQHCPVPGVVFPQLLGQEITEYTCPECTDRMFAQALFLARHLRNAHDWSVDDLVKFGTAMGLDFQREFSKAAKVTRTYAPEQSHPARPTAPAMPAPAVTIERVVPIRETLAAAAAEVKAPSEKQLAARAAAAERMRARHAAARAAKQQAQ